MKWVMCFLLLAGSKAWAGAVTPAAPLVEWTGGESYSCRILRHRIRDRWKGDAAKYELIMKMEKEGWTAALGARLQGLMGRTGYFPKSYYEPNVKVSVRWAVPAEWAAILSSGTAVGVHWSFKQVEWADPAGIMPADVITVWNSRESVMEVSTLITPSQLCYGPGALQLKLSTGGEVLELRSEVNWE